MRVIVAVVSLAVMLAAAVGCFVSNEAGAQKNPPEEFDKLVREELDKAPIRNIDDLAGFGCDRLFRAVADRQSSAEIVEGGRRYRLYNFGQVRISTQVDEREVMSSVTIPAGELLKLGIVPTAALDIRGFEEHFGRPFEKQPQAHLYGSKQFEWATIWVKVDQNKITSLEWLCD
jgi:hypothetical protein